MLISRLPLASSKSLVGFPTPLSLFLPTIYLYVPPKWLLILLPFTNNLMRKVTLLPKIYIKMICKIKLFFWYWCHWNPTLVQFIDYCIIGFKCPNVLPQVQHIQQSKIDFFSSIARNSPLFPLAWVPIFLAVKAWIMALCFSIRLPGILGSSWEEGRDLWMWLWHFSLYFKHLWGWRESWPKEYECNRYLLLNWTCLSLSPLQRRCPADFYQRPWFSSHAPFHHIV